MNKLLGFYELKESNIPTIPWKEFDISVSLDSNLLWTIRSAVYRGNDLNLPRLVGAKATEAQKFANNLHNKIKDNGMVIYYPYFLAEKSGTLNIFWDKIVIEAVKDDLWNLVTYSDREVTLIIKDDDIECNGNKDFISNNELNELILNAGKAKKIFRNELLEGKSILLEWSYAFDSDIDKNKVGQEYLVFYEARTV